MGPICQILLELPLDDGQLTELNSYITHVGEMYGPAKDREWNFWIKTDKIIPRTEKEKGCVFSVYVWEGLTEEYEASYEMEEEDLKQIEQKIGFRPHGHIQIDAGCNQKTDHLLLGKMTSELLDKFGGYVDFGGALVAEHIEGMPGNIFDIWYENINGKHHYQIADKIFLDDWINNKNFRMIK